MEMKPNRRILQMIFFLLFLPLILSAEVFPEFSGKGDLKLVNAEKRSQALRNLPDGKGVLLEIDEGVFPYAELHLRKPRKIPDFREAEWILKFWSDNPAALQGFSLRLTDRNAETFQFPGRQTSFVKGENSLVFRVGESVPGSSWGRRGVVDRKIDFPAVLTGITCRIRRNAGRQTVRILSLELREQESRRTFSEQPFLFFDARSKLLCSAGNCSGEQTENGWRFRMKGRRAVLREHKWSLRTFPVPRRIVFHADVRKGSGTLQLDGVAENGAEVHLETPFSQGARSIVLEWKENSGVRFQKLTLVSREPEMEILFRSSRIRSAATAAEAIGFDVETGNELHLLKAGEGKNPVFVFTNTSPEFLEGGAELKLHDFFGREIRRKISFALRPREKMRVPIVLPKERALGFWKAVARISAGSPESEMVRETSFALLHPAGPTIGKKAEGFLFGVCSHTARWSVHDRRLEAEAAGICGVKVLRTKSHWHSIQPSPEIWNFREFDELVSLFGRQGIELQGGFGYGTRWAAPENVRNSRKWTDWHRAMPDLKAWKTYVAVTAARYRGRIRFWEVWNEPDLYSFAHFGSEEYASLLKTAWTEVKKMDPNALVMNGGFASVRPIGKSGKDNVRFQKEVLRSCRGFYDIHAHHEHGSFPVYASAIDRLLIPMRRETGADAVPWYANETAIASTGGGEVMQAVTLFKKLLFSWSRGAIGYTWYNLRNDGLDPYNSEHHYGMMTTDFHPKPVYPVYNMLAVLYGNARYLEQRSVGNGIYLLLFQKDKDLLAAVWNEQNNPTDLPFLLQTDAQEAERIDIMGNPEKIALNAGAGVFTIGATPATLLLKNASRVLFPGPVMELMAPQAAVRGKEFPVEFRLRNPLKKTLNPRFELESSPFFRMERGMERSFSCSIPPESQRSVLRCLRMAPDLPGDFKRKFRLRLRFVIPELKSAGVLELPFQKAVAIPKTKNRKQPDFVMDRRASVFSFWEGQPDKKHLLWQGKDDLSAAVSLALNGESLKVAVKVRDDVHAQPSSGRLVWEGDNVQFALTIPGQAGSWEIGLSRLNSGKSEVFVWIAPAGFDPAETAAGIHLRTERNLKNTLYYAEIPLAILGTTEKKMRQGIRFNLLVNDNDGICRKGGIQIAPHLKNPEQHPMLIFE